MLLIQYSQLNMDKHTLFAQNEDSSSCTGIIYQLLYILVLRCLPQNSPTYQYSGSGERRGQPAVYVGASQRGVGMSDSEYALQARLHAKPEKAEEVAEFLESALPMAEEEEGTTTWFALRFDETTFGIFDTFPDEEARQAHLDGEIAAALMDNADELLAEEPQIEEVDVLAAKHSE
jgi:quinol monooxygenase YgiN